MQLSSAFATVRVTALILLASALLWIAPASASASASAREHVLTGTRQHWQWPLMSRSGITRPFIAPVSPYSAGHRGIDLAATRGAPIAAPADGTVRFSGVVVDRPVLTIEHASGLVSSFEPVASQLAPGSIVHRGEILGTVSAGGHCSQKCLHFGVRLHGQYISPLTLLENIPTPVLLPTRPFR